jgi:hypothetical protein
MNCGHSSENAPTNAGYGLPCVVLPGKSSPLSLAIEAERVVENSGSKPPPPIALHTAESDFWEAYQVVIPAQQHTAVGKETGLTAHVERWNNTLRQRLGRFVRKSLSFSKSDAMHELCLRLFLHDYNLSLTLSRK